MSQDDGSTSLEVGSADMTIGWIDDLEVRLADAAMG